MHVPRNREFRSIIARFEVNDGLRIATPLRTALDVPVKVDQYAVREIERRDRGRRGRGVGGGPADVGGRSRCGGGSGSGGRR
ncbi:hypothetical protein QP028_10250 [Corynebacterium suedekumii]|nr:hypothetical protein QP028_10250 [Corynebacterium suedekumii]